LLALDSAPAFGIESEEFFGCYGSMPASRPDQFAPKKPSHRPRFLLGQPSSRAA